MKKKQKNTLYLRNERKSKKKTYATNEKAKREK